MRRPEPRQRFTSVLAARPRGGITVRLPFDPDVVWNQRPRHDVHGTIGGHGFRGPLTRLADGYAIDLGPSWCRDPAVRGGTTHEVVVEPEPPQLATVSPDVAEAILADPAARATFGSIATHYRLNFVRWIEDAKRPETRAKRIDETVATLRTGRRER